MQLHDVSIAPSFTPSTGRIRSAPGGDAKAIGQAPSWSLFMGQVAGVRVYVHGTFFILLAWIFGSQLRIGAGSAGAWRSVVFTLVVFAVVLLHEFGHALMARHFGFRTRDITLLPIGGVSRLEHIPEKPSQELLVALAGPAVNIVLSIGLFVWLRLSHSPVGFEDVPAFGGSLPNKLMWVNVSLATFNLLPAFPMDGGRIFRALLSLRLDRPRATQIAARAGVGMAFLFGVLGVFSNPMLLVIALFVWVGARQEEAMVGLQSLLHGISVRDVMLPDVRVLEPGDWLYEVADGAVHTDDRVFAVSYGGKLVGVLTLSEALRTLSERGPSALVSDAGIRDYEVALPEEPLDAAIERCTLKGRAPLLAVEAGGRAVGVVTPEIIGERIVLERARRRGHAHGV